MKRLYFIALLLAGCAASTGEQSKTVDPLAEYPATWPKPVNGREGNCVALNGVYEYFGEEVPAIMQKNWVTFETIFAMIPTLEVGNRYAFEINHDATRMSLQVKVVNLDQSDLRAPIRSFVLPFPNEDWEFSCSNGWVVIWEAVDAYTDGVTFKGSQQWRLTKAVDGSLIIGRYFFGTKTSFFFIHSDASGGSWFRFLPVKNSKK